MAGVALGDYLRFTWQAWHKLTSTVVLRGRRGTYGTGWRPWAGIWRRGAARRKRSNLLTNNLLTNNLHTYIPTYRPTYIHTYIPTILPSRSFTISFVFLCFPVPAKTIEAHFREKLTCGVIRSFNWLLLFRGRQQWAAASQIQGRQAPQACTHQWSYILHGSRTATYHQR